MVFSVFKWLYIVLTCVLMLAFGSMFAGAYYLYSSHASGLTVALIVLGGVVAFVLRDGFGKSLVPWLKAEPVQARQLPWKYAGLIVGYVFAGWCVYMGVYVPRQYEAALSQIEHRLGVLTEDSVGEDDVGESLD